MVWVSFRFLKPFESPCVRLVKHKMKIDFKKVKDIGYSVFKRAYMENRLEECAMTDHVLTNCGQPISRKASKSRLCMSKEN